MMGQTFKQHWREYLMEAAELGLFMVSAGLFVILIEHPGFFVRQSVESPLLRRAMIGFAMGLTAILLILSPWGKRSGAHMNPAVTWSFYRLGKVKLWDAIFYTLFQFIGGVAGLFIVGLIFRESLAHSDVNYVATLPGAWGEVVAFFAEVIISFILFMTILAVSHHAKLAPYTAFFAGALLVVYITFEAPLSGMSINPARTFGSAFMAGNYSNLWIYFVAPMLGMLLAAELFISLRGARKLMCATLDPKSRYKCIFHCPGEDHELGHTAKLTCEPFTKLQILRCHD